MIDKFKDYMRELRLSQNSIDSYYSDVVLYEKYYKDSYGDDLNKLVFADILMYKQYLLNNSISPKTINRKLTSLRTYNRFLIKEKIQTDEVITDKDYIKIQPPIPSEETLSVQDINKLKHYTSIDNKTSKRDFCIISILCYSGLRASELANLKVKDIKLDERTIYVFGKGNKFRTVVINNIMYTALTDYLEERNKIAVNNPYLFLSQKSKNTVQPISRNFSNRLLDKYKELCKISDLHPHLLRDFFATNALHNAGYSIEQVANQLGHSNINTTKGYLRTKKEDLLNLANNL